MTAGSILKIEGVEVYTELLSIGLPAAYDLLGAAMFVIKKGHIIYCNRAATTLFGWGTQEMLGKPIEMLLPEAMREAHVKRRDSYEAHPRPRQMANRMEVLGQTKAGESIRVTIGLSYLDTGHGVLPVAEVRAYEK